MNALPTDTMFANFDRFEIQMTRECALDCSTPGQDATESVEHWLPKIETIGDILPEDLRAELKEVGAWDDSELDNEQDNRERILWIAACNIREEMS